MKYKYLLLTAALLFYSKLASAVTLQEALALAYNNNQDIQVARQAFMGEIQAMPEALSGFMPRISADVSATNQKQTTVGQYSDNRPSTNNSSGVNRNITLRQPLFNGGSTVAAVKAAQSGFRASRGKLYAIEQDALLNSIDAYLSCYEAQETYAITNSSVEFNKQVLEATEIKLKLGEATITDVALARAQFAKSQAEKANAFAKLQSAKAVSSKMFGTELSDLALPEVPSNLPSSLDDLLVKAEAMNPSLQQATHALAAVKSNAVAAKGALLPSAEFSAALGRRYNGEETITNPNYRSFTTTLGVHIPIFDKGGAEYAAIRRANSAARQAAHQLENQMRDVKVNAITAWESHNASKISIAFADEAVEASTLALDGVKHEYAVGSKTILDILEAETKMLSYQINSITTKKNYILSAYKIKASMGECVAKALHLPVKYFRPEMEFQKVKAKIIGF